MVELYVRLYLELKHICLATPRKVDNGMCGVSINKEYNILQFGSS
jgi:hypothetical protein